MLPNVDDSVKAGDASPFISQNPATLSPNSETFSQPAAADSAAARGTANGLSAKAPKEPPSAFKMYCEEVRPAVLKSREEKGDDQQAGEGELSVDEELARKWADLPESEKKTFQTRHEEAMAQYKKDKEAHEAAAKKKAKKDVSSEGKGDQNGSAEPERAPESGKKDMEVDSPAVPEETMKDADEATKTGEEAEKADKDKSKSPSGSKPTTRAEDEDVEMTMDDDNEGEPKEKPSEEKQKENTKEAETGKAE